jgi:hypothetical protein
MIITGPLNLRPAKRLFGLALLASLLTSTSFGQVLETTDSALNNGADTSLTYTAPGLSTQYLAVPSRTDASTVLWHFGPDPYAVKQGSGSIKMSYKSEGGFVTEVNLSGLDRKVHVAAYPFIQYGGSCFGGPPCQQPPHFPTPLNKISSLVFDIEYDLSGTLNGTCNVLFDQWLVPKVGYDAGQKGAVEVEIMPFYRGAPKWGTFKKNITLPATVNGADTTIVFAEYVALSGPAKNVLFYPGPGSYGMTSGALKFDALPLHLEAAAQSGVDKAWLIPGVCLGNELGDSESENFTFTLKRFGIQQTVTP